MSVSKKPSASMPVWLRPFTTALLDKSAVEKLNVEYLKLDDIEATEQIQCQIYEDEKQNCIEKYGKMVDVAYNFDQIFSVHIMQVYADIQFKFIQLNEEAEMRNVNIIEQMQKNEDKYKAEIEQIQLKLDSMEDKGKFEIEQMQLQIDSMEDKCVAANARAKACETEAIQTNSLYKMVLRELKLMENMQLNVIVVQIYICVILAMLVAIGANMVTSIGCEEYKESFI